MDEETETGRLSILTEVTGLSLTSELPLLTAVPSESSPTVLDPVKLELFIRAGCGTRPWGGKVSESETAGSGLRNESPVKQSERKNGSGDDNRCQSWCECAVWEWGQSHAEETCGCSLSPFTHLPPPSPCPKSSLIWFPFWLFLHLQTRSAQSSCPGGRDTAVPVEMRKPLLLSDFESFKQRT